MDWLTSEGELSDLVRATDWARTPLGNPDTWPSSLRTVVRIMLTSRYAMWMGWGPDLTFFYNDAYRPTLGVKHPRALGAPASQVWAEIWPEVGPRVETVLRTGQATWDEGLLLFLERSGYPEETYHTFSYSPLADDAGVTCGMLCVVTEETDRILAERRVAFLRVLASEMAAVRSRTDVFQGVTRCVSANDRDAPFLLTYLYDQDGRSAQLACAAGAAAGEPIAPEAILLDDAALWPAREIAGGGPAQVVPIPAGLPAPKGSWDLPPTQALALPLAQQGQETAAGFLVIGLNPYRKLDSDYQGFLELVAGQIASGLATATAHEEERRRAEALAELDRAKTVFFSNISHEFRTPLTLILGPAEDALATANDAEQRQRLELMQRNALRLQRLVNSLLDFSRIEAGRVQAAFQPTDLGALTAELASTFRSAVEKAGLQLEVSSDPQLQEPVYVDREMWEKVVLNLLSNAFKHTFEGGICVEVRQVGGEAELAVSDTGVGISEEELPRLFERFHRVHSARSRTHEGSGIGLALVQELIRLHGGGIEVESAPGSGTTFRVRVPFGRDHLPADQVREAAVAGSPSGAGSFITEALQWLGEDEAAQADTVVPSGATSGPRRRIVLADDNADMRDYVFRLLSPTYDVEAVGDGLAALEAARREEPDLVLTDVMMPRLDGFGLLRELRSDPRIAATPVVILSARSGEESRIQGLEQGADDYLVKPFSARELLARVGAILELSQARAAATEAVRESEERFRNMADHSPLMLWVTDERGECIYLNRRWYEFTGQTEAEGLGLGWTDAVHPDDRQAATDIFLEATREKRPFRLEYRLRQKDGEYRWAIDAASPRVGADGEFLGFVGSVIDITERKRAEEEARQESGRLRELAQVALAFNGAHSNGEIRDILRAALQRQILAGEVRIHLVNSQDVEADSERIDPDLEAALRDTGGPVREDREDGRLAAALRGREGAQLGMVQLSDPFGGSFTEVDEAVTLQLAAMAGVALESARLYEDLRQEDRRKDEFLAMLAHELRNPLAPIRNALHLLNHPSVQPAQRQRAQELVHRQVGTLTRLVNDLLDVSRVTRGKVRLELAPTALSRVVAQAVETCQPLIEEQKHRLEIIVPDEPLIVQGDLTRLTQVLSNLLNNAAKYTEAGGLIRLEVHRDREDAIINVSDTGVGMTAEVLSSVFELFTQADRSLDRSQGGLGIGLALTQKLVEMHGGRIRASSPGPGKGSEFEVRIPIAGPGEGQLGAG